MSGTTPVPPGVIPPSKLPSDSCWPLRAVISASRSIPDAIPGAAEICRCSLPQILPKAPLCGRPGWRNSRGTGRSSVPARAVWMRSVRKAGTPGIFWSFSLGKVLPVAGQTGSKLRGSRNCPDPSHTKSPGRQHFRGLFAKTKRQHAIHHAASRFLRWIREKEVRVQKEEENT